MTVSLRHGDDAFEIEVRDTGQGMTPEFLQHAFDRFRQADSSLTRSHGGLGIGLAIARHLTELHGGFIAAESPGPGLGSGFLVRLPRSRWASSAARAEPEPRAAAVEREPGSLDGIRVLLAEDQWDGRELMAEILRSAGCEVVATGSAQEAFEALRTARPDVLVSDIGMPGEDGYSLLRRIRQGRRSNSSRSPRSPSRRMPAKRIGSGRSPRASSSISRSPSSPPTFRGRQPRDAPRSPGETAAAEGEVREPPRHRILVVEDHADVREGLRELLESSGYAVDVAEDGARGIEQALTHRPRIALIDIGLPGVDGFGVAQRIRSLVPKEELTLVALTGHTHPDDLLRVVESGFDAYLPKPISFDKLDALLSARLAVAPRSPLND